MKANILLLGAILASSTIATTTYADNATRVAATSALGSVVGTAIGKEIGGHNGALIGSAVGGAGGAAAASSKRTRTEAAIGGGLGGVGGYAVGKNVGGTTGGYIGAAAGAAGGAALGRQVGQDRYYDSRQNQKKKWKRKNIVAIDSNKAPSGAFLSTQTLRLQQILQYQCLECLSPINLIRQ